MKILNSASRIVFVLMAISLVILTALGTVDAKDFIVLCGMAFTYYFTKQPPTQTSEPIPVIEPEGCQCSCHKAPLS